MKKKLLILLLAGTMCMTSLTGCGSANETATTVAFQTKEESVPTKKVEQETTKQVEEATTKKEETTTKKVEEETTTKVTETVTTMQAEQETTKQVEVETTTKELSIVEKDTLKEDENKIFRLINYYNTLLERNIYNEGDELPDERLFQSGLENLVCYDEIIELFENGEELFGERNNNVLLAYGIDVYWNYINENSDYIKFVDYVNTNKHIRDNIEEKYFSSYKEEWNTEDIILLDAIATVGYFYDKNISLKDKVESDYMFADSDMQAAYSYTLICNGEDIGFDVLYDKDGNFLGFIVDEDVNIEDYIYID